MQSADSQKQIDILVEQNGQVQPSSASETSLVEHDSTTVLDRDLPPVPPPTPIKPLLVKWGIVALFGVGAIAASISAYHWWQDAQAHQETDNAYITADIHPVNARIAGTVVQVAVADNQVVQSGSLLVTLDARDYQIALEQAQAALKVAQEQANVAQANINITSTNAMGQTTQAQSNMDAANASIARAEAALNEAQAGVLANQSQVAAMEAHIVKAKLDYVRYRMLFHQGAISKAQFDAAKAAYNSLIAQRVTAKEQVSLAQARVAQAQENLLNTKAKLAFTRGTVQPANATEQQTKVNQQQYKAAIAAIDQARVQVNNAQLQLSYTKITAPTDGQMGNRTVQVGQRVQPGQTLMSVVSPQPWIIANFKETQLAKMLPGQEVEVKIDAFPHRTFKGKVDSLSPASGAKFALLPPDNATDNFTKIVQRLPVKVVFNPNSIRGYESRIAPGMSVVVSVETR